MQPTAVSPGHNALGTQHLAIIAGIQRLQSSGQLRFFIGVSRLPTPAGEHFIRVMMLVVMAAAVTTVPVMVVMLMLVTAAVAVVLVMVVMFVFLLLRQLLQGGSQGIATLHGGQQLFAVQFVPGGGYNSRGGVLFPQQRHTGIQLFLLHATPSPLRFHEHF